MSSALYCGHHIAGVSAVGAAHTVHAVLQHQSLTAVVVAVVVVDGVDVVRSRDGET